MSKQTLRIGAIGYGLRGTLLQAAHLPEEGVAVTALADVDEQVFERFRETYGPDALCVTDYRALLERNDIDAVFILSPDHLHEEHAIESLKAGKAVYLEKPMAITIEGCDRILRTAQDTGSKLYVGHNMRHMAFVLKMKQLIDDKAIGEVKTAWCRHFIAYGGDAYFKDWHAERQKTTGLLLQKACHDIDVLHWLCGGYSVRVSAMGRLALYDRIQNRRSPDEPTTADWHEQNWPPLSQEKLNPIIDVEDINMLQSELDNGILMSYQQCHFTPDAWRNYTIIGTEGRIENIGEERIRLWRSRQDKYWPGDEDFETPKASGGHSGADPKIVKEFIDHVREDAPTSISPIAARMSVATAYMATMSLRNGGVPMAVPPVMNE